MMECLGSAPAASTATVLENRQVGPGCYRMCLENDYIARCTLPGQFVHVRIPGSSLDPLLRRPFSVCLVEPSNGAFLVLYQVVGRGTKMLSALRPGDRLDVLGPLGRGFEMPRAGAGGGGDDGSGGDGGNSIGRGSGAVRVALVAGGLGIAPLIMLSHALFRSGVGFVFVVGARSGELLAGLDLLPRAPGRDAVLSGRSASPEPAGPEIVQGAHVPPNGCDTATDDAGPRYEVHVVTEDGSMGRRGLVTDALRDVLRGGDIACAYACGPAGMLREVARMGETFRVPVQVSLEERMACGLGACLGCAVKAREATARSGRTAYLRVCADGPVFWVEEVDLDGIG
ncbi:MAG: dihydroorotate dehydrogenase electron transfer subunit [Firmicutes bacterium]|nr:dihydroorotate dehydrogenase electron transfer subunit [Bacillota bacterium]